MRNIVKIFILESVVIVVVAMLISSVYILVLPRYFADQRTYSVLIGGLAIASVAAAYIARQTGVTTRPSGWLIIVLISGIVTVATLFLSLFFILNILGS